MLEPSTPGFDRVQSGEITTGASVRVTGALAASPGAKQAVEIKATGVELVSGAGSWASRVGATLGGRGWAGVAVVAPLSSGRGGLVRTPALDS